MDALDEFMQTVEKAKLAIKYGMHGFFIVTDITATNGYRARIMPLHVAKALSPGEIVKKPEVIRFYGITKGFCVVWKGSISGKAPLTTSVWVANNDKDTKNIREKARIVLAGMVENIPIDCVEIGTLRLLFKKGFDDEIKWIGQNGRS